MILARLASAIRHQNWSQIITEILIVIIGIFLGLQVQAWYEGKQALEEEARIIDYFINDVEYTLERWIGQNNFHRTNLRTGEVVLKSLEHGALLPEDHADFLNGLNDIGKTSAIGPYLNSFTEENLNRVQSMELRRIIDAFLGRKERENAIISHTIVNIDTSLGHVNNRIAVGEPTGDNRIAIYDFDALKDDREFISAFASIQIRIIDISIRYDRAIANIKLLHEALLAYRNNGTVVDAANSFQ